MSDYRPSKITIYWDRSILIIEYYCKGIHNRVQSNFSKLVAFSLIIVMISFKYNMIVNRHAHLENGHIIYSSHPYGHDPGHKTPYPSHQHGLLDFLILDQVSDQNSILIASVFSFTGFICKISEISAEYSQDKALQQYFCYKICRAPPVSA